MKRNTWFAWVAFCGLFAAQGCRKPLSDWNGVWELNQTKSSFQGQVLTISNPTGDQYHFDEGYGGHDIRCNGKDQPIGNNRTLVCVKSGGTMLDISLKENGVKTRTTHDELSSDGNLFTTTVTKFQPNGATVTSQIIFSRLSGSNDFLGRWLDKSYLQQHADMVLRLDNQALHVNYPSAGQYVDVPLNGVDTAMHGPHALDGATLAVRPAGYHEFLIVTKRQGKVLSQSSLKLSDDGRVITDSWWNPDRPDIKAMLIYERK